MYESFILYPLSPNVGFPNFSLISSLEVPTFTPSKTSSSYVLPNIIVSI